MIKIDTKLPVDFVMRSAILSLIFGGFIVQGLLFDSDFLTNKYDYQPILLVTTFLILASMFDLYLRKGYSIWYDNESIYWRKVGLARKSANVIGIKFDEIRNVYGIGGRSEVGKFDAIGLSSGDDPAADILLSTQYIRDSDLITLLERVKLSAKAKFDDSVLEYMELR